MVSSRCFLLTILSAADIDRTTIPYRSESVRPIVVLESGIHLTQRMIRQPLFLLFFYSYSSLPNPLLLRPFRLCSTISIYRSSDRSLSAFTIDNID